jgi:NDP-sugar pyrophosphorylase family protein
LELAAARRASQGALRSPFVAGVFSLRRMVMTTAVVLAAGRGSRMGALTATMPKPLLAVAGHPLIAHVLRGLAAAGVRRAVIVTGYLGAQLEAAPFVVCWGDILVPAPFYREFVEAFAARPCDAQLAVNAVDDPWRGAAVYVAADGRVTRLEEKPPRGSSTTGWNNAGIMLFDPLILDYARRLAPSPRGEYELPQAVTQMVRDGRRVYAVPVRGPWSDVGTADDLAAAQTLFAAPDVGR